MILHICLIDIMKKLMFILVLLLGCCDCKKENSIDIFIKFNWRMVLDKNMRWDWNSLLDASHNHTSGRIIFTSDSTYNLYQNDTLMFSTKFHTYSTISEDGKYTTHIIKYDSGFWGMYSLSHDTLSVIDEGGITFFTSSYKRIK